MSLERFKIYDSHHCNAGDTFCDWAQTKPRE